MKSHRVLDMGLHSNLILLCFLSVGSPKHKVLEVGLLKRLAQLKELSISPLVKLDWKDQVGLSLQEL